MEMQDLTAIEAARRMRDGEMTAEEYTAACLARIEATEAQVQAWAHLDSEHALEQARMLDQVRQAGEPCGPLHGVPVGIKDIFDTRVLPTENGTAIDAGRQPDADARVVSLLREAGAVIMGKTVTTELAVYHPGKTRNPHNPDHTPGGSSSGSAAAVAAHMVPLSVGTQTNGSIVRPGAYCGVFGYKPTHGLISRHGGLVQSPPLDTVGVYGNTLQDAALLADVLAVYDERDPSMRPQARPQLLQLCESDPPLDPVFAFVKGPVWDQAEDETKDAFAELADFLDDRCREVTLPPPFDHAIALHRTIMLGDFAKSFRRYYEKKDLLSDALTAMIEEGQGVLAADYNTALDWVEVLNAGLDEIFETADAILTPAAPGTAPQGLDATGSPAFCTLWTLCGTPAVTLPLMQGENGLPMGVQLVGRRREDGRLLRSARWLVERVENAEGNE